VKLLKMVLMLAYVAPSRLLVEFGASISGIELYNPDRIVSLLMLFYVILLLFFTFVYYMYET
jgi:hypothetical protein